MVTEESRNKVGKHDGISVWWIAITALISVLICSVISWVLINNMTAAKSDYIQGSTKVDNTLIHIQDANEALNIYDGYQDTKVQEMYDSTQVKVEDIEGRTTANEVQIGTKAAIADLNSLKITVDGKASTMDVNALKAEVYGKANTADLNTLKNTVDTKANIDDVNTLITTVNTKANSTDLDTLKATVDTKANYSDLQVISATSNNITIVVPSGIIDATYDQDRYIWTVDGSYQVTSITFQQSNIESTGSSTTLMLKNVPSGTAISSGMDLLASAINLKSGVSANTALTATLNSSTSNLQFTAGNSLALDFTNPVTEYLGCVTITLKRI